MRSRSEALGVKLQRMDAGRRLAESPSLRAALADLLAQAWTFAVLAAQRDTGLDASNFPADCAWTPEQALGDAFLPD